MPKEEAGIKPTLTQQARCPVKVAVTQRRGELIFPAKTPSMRAVFQAMCPVKVAVTQRRGELILPAKTPSMRAVFHTMCLKRKRLL